MPANCSTLIQRKQNILHKVLRSNSDGKIQNAISETTAELCVGGTKKATNYVSTTNRFSGNAPAMRRSTIQTNATRSQALHENLTEKYLPSIRENSANADRYPLLIDVGRPKTPIRPTSGSPSSLLNPMAKRSTENMMTINGDIEEAILTTPIPPPSRRSQRPTNSQSKSPVSGMNITSSRPISGFVKQSTDSGVDIHFSSSANDNHQIYRSSTFTSKTRNNGTHLHAESTYFPETQTRERTGIGQLYQRRTNYQVKAPIKQKIDKYRRRSEETVNATQSNNLLHVTHAGLTATAPTLTTPAVSRHRIPPPLSPKPVRRVTSDAEVRARLEVLRLSMDTTLARTDETYSRPSVKSPILYSTHQQLAPSSPTKPSSGVLRSTHTINNRVTSAAPSPTYHQTIGSASQRRTKNSPNPNPTNLYLAFIASRHVSNLENATVECDIEHPKLLRIFQWIKTVEEFRDEQRDHDQLILEQNQLMAEQPIDYSLYSEVEYAVDDLPPNTTGKTNVIPTMNFEK